MALDFLSALARTHSGSTESSTSTDSKEKNFGSALKNDLSRSINYRSQPNELNAIVQPYLKQAKTLKEKKKLIAITKDHLVNETKKAEVPGDICSIYKLEVTRNSLKRAHIWSDDKKSSVSKEQNFIGSGSNTQYISGIHAHSFQKVLSTSKFSAHGYRQAIRMSGANGYEGRAINAIFNSPTNPKSA